MIKRLISSLPQYNYMQLQMGGYCNTGGAEANWTTTFPGRHTFQYNHNGKVYFDEVERATVTPTTTNYGKRGDLTTIFNSIIHEFKITSVSTGEIICDYVPIVVCNAFCRLYDIVSNTFLFSDGYPSGSIIKTLQVTEIPECTNW